MSRSATSNRRNRHWRSCRKPSAGTSRLRRRARHWNSPNRRRPSDQLANLSKKFRQIRSIIRQDLTLRLALNAQGKKKEALDHLIEIVRRDRKWNDDGARKQLVQLFDAWGATDEATLDGRKRLSSILFA